MRKPGECECVGCGKTEQTGVNWAVEEQELMLGICNKCDTPANRKKLDLEAKKFSLAKDGMTKRFASSDGKKINKQSKKNQIITEREENSMDLIKFSPGRQHKAGMDYPFRLTKNGYVMLTKEFVKAHGLE